MRLQTIPFPSNGPETNVVQLPVSERSVVIVGANGSGKTHLGSFIAGQLPSKTVRVAAQRSLQIGIRFNPTSYDGALEAHLEQTRRSSPNPLAIQQDFESLMVALFSEDYQVSTRFRQRLKPGEVTPPIPETKLDKIKKLFAKLLPHRTLEIDGATIKVHFGEPPGISGYYWAQHMSDGERVVLYLAGQVLCAPEGSCLIVDEPEVHLHKAICAKLWDELELLREDCLFVYLTHDLEFAATRQHSKKICLRSYNTAFEWYELPPAEEIPETTYLEIVGSRRPVLFVEGDKSSLDYALFRIAYPDYTVKPVGGCQTVINATVAFNRLSALHHLQAFGIIDRDFRSADEVASLGRHSVHCLNHAHVENVFLSEDVLRVLAAVLGIKEDEAIAAARKTAFRLLKENSPQLVRDMSVARIERLFSGFPGSDPVQTLDEIRRIDFARIQAETSAKLDEILATNDYARLLEVFKNKGLLNAIGGAALGVKPGTFIERLKVLVGNKNLQAALLRMLPKIEKSTTPAPS